MARVRIEFVELGISPSINGNQNILAGLPLAVADLTVATTATVAGVRPTAPAFNNLMFRGHARVTVLDAAVIVCWGDDPTASAVALGIRLEAGAVEIVPIKAGQKLSFIEVA